MSGFIGSAQSFRCAPRGRVSRGRSAGCFPSLEVVAPLLSAAGLPARNIFCHEAAKHTKKKISWFSSWVLRVFVSSWLHLEFFAAFSGRLGTTVPLGRHKFEVRLTPGIAQ